MEGSSVAHPTKPMCTTSTSQADDDNVLMIVAKRQELERAQRALDEQNNVDRPNLRPSRSPSSGRRRGYVMNQEKLTAQAANEESPAEDFILMKIVRERARAANSEEAAAHRTQTIQPPTPELQYDNLGRVLKSSFLTSYSGPTPGAYASVALPSPNNGHLGTSRIVAEAENEERFADEATGETLSSLDESDRPVILEGALKEEIRKLRQKNSCLVVLVFAFLMIAVVAIVTPLAVLLGNPSEVPPMVDKNPVEGSTKDEVGLLLVPNMSNLTINALADPVSPQHQAYDSISRDPKWDTYEDWRKQQRFAMYCFFYGFRISQFSASFRPRNDAHECDWIVGSDTCNGQDPGKVTVLKLSYARGQGGDLLWPLPSELSFLKQLEVLDLSHIKLRPSLEELLPIETLHSMPPSLRELKLQDCELKGSIPSALGLLTSLTHLDLSQNSLTSSIPSQLGLLTNLRSLLLSGNPLSLTIPYEVLDLPHLTDFTLEDNPEESNLEIAGLAGHSFPGH